MSYQVNFKLILCDVNVIASYLNTIFFLNNIKPLMLCVLRMLQKVLQNGGRPWGQNSANPDAYWIWTEDSTTDLHVACVSSPTRCPMSELPSLPVGSTYIDLPTAEITARQMEYVRFGTEATFTCISGYGMLSSSSSQLSTYTCTKNGSWTLNGELCQGEAFSLSPLVKVTGDQVVRAGISVTCSELS